MAYLTQNPFRTLVEGLVLRFKPYNLDVLPLYIVLALLVPTAAFAQQQHQKFRDANGRTLGRSVTDSRGNVTY